MSQLDANPPLPLDLCSPQRYPLPAENSRLKTQFRTQEEDREYLIKQLVAAKKDNARLRQELNRSREEAAAASAQLEDARLSQQVDRLGLSFGGAAGGGGHAGMAAGGALPAVTDEDALRIAEAAATGASLAVTTVGGALAPLDEARYKEVIHRLKKLLDAERRSAKQARAALTAEVASRTEAEMFLRAAVEEAKGELESRRQQVAGGSPRPGTSPRYPGAAAGGGKASSGRRGSGAGMAAADEGDGLGREEREQILASLLAQEHVLNALQRVAFPHRHGGEESDGHAEAGAAAPGGSAAPAALPEAAMPSRSPTGQLSPSAGGRPSGRLGAAGEAYAASTLGSVRAASSVAAGQAGRSALSRSGYAVATPQPAGAGAGRPSAALGAVFDAAGRPPATGASGGGGLGGITGRAPGHR
jgi:hypothetical protein